MASGLSEQGLIFWNCTALKVTPTPEEVEEQWLLMRWPLNERDDLTSYGHPMR